jgi:UDP-glucuronate 4-epimerase
MAILVTGGAGFIGSHVCEALLQKGGQVICVDDFNDYYNPLRKHKNIEEARKSPNFFLETCDVTNYRALKYVFEKHHIHKIIHLAARAGVRGSLRDPKLYELVNIHGLLNVLQLCVEFNVRHVVFASTSSVYGINKKTPFAENDRVDTPINQYAVTKRAGELLCHTYNHVYGIKTACLRFFTVYGPRGRPDMATHIFTKAINEGQEFEVYGDGTAQRDFTYVGDIVEGVLSAVYKPFDYEIINLGNSRTISVNKLISVIEENLGKKARVKYTSTRAGDMPITYASIQKAKELLNWEPSTTIEVGVKKYVEWFKQQT